MNEMIDRVARAIYEQAETYPNYALVGLNGGLAEDFARAAIEAMREPTPEMIEAHQSLCVYPNEDDKRAGAENLREAWQAMIHSALGTGE